MSAGIPEEQTIKTRSTPERWPLRILTAVRCMLRQACSPQASRLSSATPDNRDAHKWRRARQKRRTLERDGGPGYTSDEFQDLCRQYGERCLCCGRRLPLVADHIVPLSEGGEHSIDNIQPLCRTCNSRKHTLTVDFREEENRFRFFVGKAGKRRHFLRPGQMRTLCGLSAYRQTGFSEVSGKLPLCRKCVEALHDELKRCMLSG